MPTSVIHLFKPGTHTAMSGAQLDFSESDLAAMVAAYDINKHEAPICIGHPKDDAPAYGWVQGLRMAADGPEAIPHQVNADFAELHKSGAFKKISASFYPPASPHNPVPGVYYLRHVAFLGAQPPAIKGLRAPRLDFAELDDCVCIEFAEPDPLPQPEDNPVNQEELDALKAQNQELQAKLDAFMADKAKAEAARIEEKNTEFAEKLASETRLSSEAVPVVAAALSALQANEKLNFGEGDAAKPLHQALADALAAMPARVEFGEAATKDKAAAQAPAEEALSYAEGTAPESIELDKKIRAYMKANQVSYTKAAYAVANQ